MSEHAESRTEAQLTWGTVLKVLMAAALVWLALQIVQLVLVLIVAVLLAVALNPVVCWFQRRGLSRAAASMCVGLITIVTIGGFLWMTWSSLSEEALYAVKHLSDYERDIADKLPGWVRNAVGMKSGEEIQSYVAPYALGFSQSVVSATAITVLGFILTVYLLVEGRETRDWLLAFVPRVHRRRVEQTLTECETVILGYVAGNVITSIIAAVCTFVALWLLDVPAALLLALLAGVSDFVPVIGFFVTLIPALLMALTVSGTTALLVLAFYILYNTAENYLISPWAYGNRLKLSNLAVILAFVIGAQAAGVIGALIPFAAIYPAIERIWLRDTVGEETVREHKAIERRKAG